MPAMHGKNAEVFIADTGGTLRDFSEVATSTGWSGERDTAESSTFGQDWKTYVPGLQDASIPLEGPLDPVHTMYLWGANNSNDPVEYKIFPQGSASGRIVIQGSALISGMEIASSTSDLVTISAEFQNTGTPTMGTVS